MKIWLDDIFPPNNDEWTWIKTVPEVKALLKKHDVEEVALDNDLGTKEEGFMILDTLEQMCMEGYKIPNVRVITFNPVARERMHKICDRIQDYVKHSWTFQIQTGKKLHRR